MIQVKDLRKTFRSKDRKSKGASVEAVRSINFAVQKGEIFGLLGPNGAGETTTMRMLRTLLTPTSGTATIAGFDLLSQQGSVRKTIGYVGQVGGLERESTGRRQRRIFDLASGIVHEPQLLFLDEPSTGLDPQNRAHVWEHVRKLNQRGATIFLSTHYLQEADALCGTGRPRGASDVYFVFRAWRDCVMEFYRGDARNGGLNRTKSIRTGREPALDPLNPPAYAAQLVLAAFAFAFTASKCALASSLHVF